MKYLFWLITKKNNAFPPTYGKKMGALGSHVCTGTYSFACL